MEVRHLRKKFNKVTVEKNQSSARKMYEKDRKTSDELCVIRNISEEMTEAWFQDHLIHHLQFHMQALAAHFSLPAVCSEGFNFPAQ